MPPLFLTFEGLDGSGKSTHLRRVAEALDAAGELCLATHEPGGSKLGESIRRVFLDVERETMDGKVELLLVFASRRQHLLEVIDPALDAGLHVLCDRFTDSTYAYQGAGRGVSFEEIDRLDDLVTGRRQPDRTILFDLPAPEARGRGQSRNRRRRGAADRLDREELAFYERVRDGFLRRADADRDRFRVVDSSGPAEATGRQVREALADLLPVLADPVSDARGA